MLKGGGAKRGGVLEVPPLLPVQVSLEGKKGRGQNVWGQKWGRDWEKGGGAKKKRGWSLSHSFSFYWRSGESIGKGGVAKKWGGAWKKGVWL